MVFNLRAHAEYLRKKAALLRHLASGIEGATSRELMAMAADMEASAAEFDRRAAAGAAAQTP